MPKITKLLKKHAEKLRFALVGSFNTALDFGILFGLVFLGLDRIPANYISTFVAFIFSFFANKTFTFRSKGGNIGKQFVLFVLVTLFGLWVIQPIIILGVGSVLDPTDLSEPVVLFAAKITATVGSLIWNYLLYSRVVFKKEKKSKIKKRVIKQG